MKFKKGDLVWLTDIALGKDGLSVGGVSGYVPNSLTKKLLQGHAAEVHDTVSVVGESELYSVRFEGGSYSLSSSYFGLASSERRKIPFRIRLERLHGRLLDFMKR